MLIKVSIYFIVRARFKTANVHSFVIRFIRSNLHTGSDDDDDNK